jgi:hypothetical protein
MVTLLSSLDDAARKQGYVEEAGCKLGCIKTEMVNYRLWIVRSIIQMIPYTDNIIVCSAGCGRTTSTDWKETFGIRDLPETQYQIFGSSPHRLSFRGCFFAIRAFLRHLGSLGYYDARYPVHRRPFKFLTDMPHAPKWMCLLLSAAFGSSKSLFDTFSSLLVLCGEDLSIQIAKPLSPFGSPLLLFV